MFEQGFCLTLSKSNLRCLECVSHKDAHGWQVADLARTSSASHPYLPTPRLTSAGRPRISHNSHNFPTPSGAKPWGGCGGMARICFGHGMGPDVVLLPFQTLCPVNQLGPFCGGVWNRDVTFKVSAAGLRFRVWWLSGFRGFNAFLWFRVLQGRADDVDKLCDPNLQRSRREKPALLWGLCGGSPGILSRYGPPGEGLRVLASFSTRTRKRHDV